MKHHLPSLDNLKAFEAAARHLSFTLAADELCISKGAVSYQIRKLEEEIQCTLFKRSVRQVFLTDAGQSLLKATKSTFVMLEDTLSRLQDYNDQSEVSIAVSTYVASRWLSSKISLFIEHYPNINIQLQHSVNSSDFKLGNIDLAIRWGPCNSRQDKNRFGEIPMSLFPVISPKLLKHHGLEGNIFDTHKLLEKPLNQIPLLCEDRQQDTWQEWFEHSQKLHNPTKNLRLTNPRRVISDANVRVQAAIDGQGFIMADDLMHNELNNSVLFAPFVETLDGYGYAFLSSPANIHNDNAHVFKQWLLNNML